MSPAFYTVANHPPLLADPTVLTLQHGTAYMVDSVSLSNYRDIFLMEDAMYGDLTDHSWSDLGEEHLPDEQDQGPAEPRVLTGNQVMQKNRVKRRRNNRRSRAQELLGTDLKLKAQAKYSLSTAATIVTNFDASTDAEVTLPGWVGQKPRSLPSRVYTFQELTQTYKLQLFPWDGRYFALSLLLLHLLPAF